MTDNLDQNISDKQDAVRSDAYLAKKNFDTEKDAFERYESSEFDDD